jgi:cytoplasmic iron level regulating protein YaaA (DUF328/UPF0246 family)
MPEQDYQNHAKYYEPHHFIFYPIVLAGLVYSGLNISKFPEHSIEWIIISLLFLLLGWLSFMMRQHYALGLQNRVIRMELRLRYYQLTSRRLEPLEKKLNFKQLAALRFASDPELPELVEKVISENMSPDTIKRSVVNWVPDHMRV